MAQGLGDQGAGQATVACLGCDGQRVQARDEGAPAQQHHAGAGQGPTAAVAGHQYPGRRAAQQAPPAGQGNAVAG